VHQGKYFIQHRFGQRDSGERLGCVLSEESEEEVVIECFGRAEEYSEGKSEVE
jgi:hypothetical protein